MKYLVAACLAAVVSGCSAVGYHGGVMTASDGYVLERKITALSGRDVELTVWAHANSEGVLEQTLRTEARAYGVRQGCPNPGIEKLVFGLENAMLDARRYARATVRCTPSANLAGYINLSPAGALPEPTIDPGMSVKKKTSSKSKKRQSK